MKQGARTSTFASLQEEEEKFVYDPTGKRDPFRKFNFAPKSDMKGRTELERYALGQLKVTAILAGFEQPYAMVENSAGRGFKISKGTKIGQNNGEVVEIHQDRVVILESLYPGR